MNAVEEGRNLRLVAPANFDLAATLDCGQAFRWSFDGTAWSGVAFGKFLRLEQRGDDIIFYDTTRDDFDALWRSYFDLDFDYGRCIARFAENPLLASAAAENPGLRILRQDLAETIFSFLISQNNNIPRIKRIIADFCEHFGENFGGHFAFPTTERIAACDAAELQKTVRCGYRARYLVETARILLSGKVDLAKIAKMPSDDAATSLQKLCGVGPKVAACILLYGMHRLDAVPVDVWMKKILPLFGGKIPECARGIEGLAQQHLFHYFRKHPAKIFAKRPQKSL